MTPQPEKDIQLTNAFRKLEVWITDTLLYPIFPSNCWSFSNELSFRDSSSKLALFVQC